MDINAATALSIAMAMPNQRPTWPPFQIDDAATIWPTPRISVIQPQVLRLLRMYVAWFAKKRESALAAIRYTTLRTPTSATMIPANSTQLAPSRCGPTALGVLGQTFASGLGDVSVIRTSFDWSSFRGSTHEPSRRACGCGPLPAGGRSHALRGGRRRQ